MTQPRRNDRFLWIVFLLLGAMWGSSYFFIKLGVDQGLPTFTLVAGRLFFGSLIIGTIVALAREPLPRTARQYGHLLVMAIVNIVVPFFLITWGERSIDSALAAILTATVPLFVIVVAPLFLPDEYVTVNRVVGLAVGFAGVLVLFVPNLRVVEANGVLGWFAVLGASIAYAVGNVYSKRNVKGLRPMIPAFFQVLFAFVITAVLAVIIDRPIGRVVVTPQAAFAVLWLGVVGTAFAYVGFFRILRDWGATRASLVAYLLPVVGILLGTVAGEAITLSRIVGTALIIAGVALVNSRMGSRRLFGSPKAASPGPRPVATGRG